MHSLLRRSVVRQPHFATSELPRNTSHLRNVERTIASLLPGATFATIKTFDSSDVDLFARLTGDENPIHISSNTASSDVIGSQFPGALYLKQSLNFRRVAQVGESLHAEVTVEKVSGARVVFLTECKTSSGEVVIDGKALALIRTNVRNQPGAR